LRRVANATVLLREERIEAVLPHGAAVPNDALRIDARGKFIIPGLIDSHVHFFQSGGLYTRPDTIDLRKIRPYTDELAWIKANLHDTFARYLRAGITSVVDAGGPFWNYDVRSLAAQTPLAPRVMAAGPLISSVERHILDPYGDPPIVKIDTVEAAKALVDREIAAHTDYVKFWWILPQDGDPAAFRPIVQSAIEYAHSKGARVIVHATELETSRLALESGTDILAHSVFDKPVDENWLELARSRNVIYVPTLIVVGNYGLTFHGTPNLSSYDLKVANPDVVATLYQMRNALPSLDPALVERINQRPATAQPLVAMHNLKTVHEAGIAIATGTDAGNIGTQHASSLYDELVVMVESGISARDVLHMTTVRGAEMMGRPADLGSIDGGNVADLVVLDRDPTADIRAIASSHLVVKNGEVFKPGEVVHESPSQTVQHLLNAANAVDREAISYFVAPDVRLPDAVSHGNLTVTKREASGDIVTDEIAISANTQTSTLRLRYRVHDGRVTAIQVAAS
jgi:imidazolonepropionase-like amidohydrolase